jgi:(4S)-4-hydroxy-5-phosphonooxypentane-2,3-dione isomerase
MPKPATILAAVMLAVVAVSAQAQTAPMPCLAAGATKPFVLAVMWRAADGKGDEIAAALDRLGPASRAEPGVLAFIAHRSPADPHDFFLYEQYRDEAAFKAHQQTEHFKTEVLGRAVPLLVKRDRIPVELLKCGS